MTAAARLSQLISPLLRCALVLIPAAAAATATPGGIADPRALSQRQTIRVLISRADADSLATAAALSFRYHTSPTALELAERAGELAPQSAVIGWLHLQLCAETPACDFRDVATVLRWVDADNGASWLPVLSAAYKDRDWMEVNRIIADMAQTKRFDLYRNRLMVLFADALYGARGVWSRGFAASDAERLDVASDIATEIVPPFISLLDSCRAATSERREDCLALSRIMQSGDAMITQIAGFDMEKRLVAADSKEARAISERRHVLEWRAYASARADASVVPWLRAARARKRLAQLRAARREEDFFVAILREHGIAPERAEIE